MLYPFLVLNIHALGRITALFVWSGNRAPLELHGTLLYVPSDVWSYSPST